MRLSSRKVLKTNFLKSFSSFDYLGEPSIGVESRELVSSSQFVDYLTGQAYQLNFNMVATDSISSTANFHREDSGPSYFEFTETVSLCCIWRSPIPECNPFNFLNRIVCLKRCLNFLILRIGNFISARRCT